MRTQIADLEKQLSGIDHQVRSLPLKEQKYVDAQRLYLINNEQYNQMLLKYNEALLIKESNVSDIDVIESAKNIGQKYVSPRPVLNYAVALFLGFFLSILYLVIRELFDNRIKSLEDLTGSVKAPLLGVVGESKNTTNLVVWESPKSAVAEAFRALRSNLKFLHSKRQTQKELENKKAKKNITILITSSISGEGKTFTSINLSSVFAISNYKTLIMGIDMRKPKIFNDFDLKNTKGLSNYLVRVVEKEEIIQKTKIPNLDFIAAGPLPPNPSELIIGDAFKELIEGLKEEYDYIIMGTSPVGLVADAYELMKYSDHNLYVVRQNYSYRNQFLLMDEKFQRKEIEHLAFILNGYISKRNSYGYGYGYFDDENFAQKGLMSRLKSFLKG